MGLSLMDHLSSQAHVGTTTNVHTQGSIASWDARVKTAECRKSGHSLVNAPYEKRSVVQIPLVERGPEYAVTVAEPLARRAVRNY